MTEKLLMTRAETAALLSIHVRTLDKLRGVNEGPPVLRIGGTYRYRRADVDRWLDQKTN